MRYTSLFAVFALFVLAACSSGEPTFDEAAYRAEIEQWRAGRMERLKAPTGFLSLAGRYWLDLPSNRLGSSEDNDLLLPGAAADRVGALVVGDTGVTLQVADGVEVLLDSKPVTSLGMHTDDMEEPVLVTHRNLGWTVIRRDERYAMRLWDFTHPALSSFPPLDYFPIDASYKVPAVLRRYEEPRVVRVDTVIEGLDWNPVSPGVVEFELNGERLQLEVYDSGDELFLVFGDRTSGKETYGAGRFLYADAPGEDGKLELDFNRAYSPPCAFTDFATCPVASMRNRMKTRIEAGELYDSGKHGLWLADH